MDTEDLMTPAQFAARIKKTARWMRTNYRSIPHRKIGRSVYFTEQDLADYIDSRRVAPASRRSKPKGRA